MNFNVTISGGDYKTRTFPRTLKDTTSYIKLPLVSKSRIYKGQNKTNKTAGLTNKDTTSATTVKTNTSSSLNTSVITIKRYII